MATFAERLAELRLAAAAGTASPALVAWAAGALEALAPPEALRGARDALLRAAAGRLTGTRYSRAGVLLAAAEQLAAGRPVPDPTGAVALLREAAALAVVPTSIRAWLRILNTHSPCGDADPLLHVTRGPVPC